MVVIFIIKHIIFIQNMEKMWKLYNAVYKWLFLFYSAYV